jgi:hypothetical protein
LRLNINRTPYPSISISITISITISTHYRKQSKAKHQIKQTSHQQASPPTRPPKPTPVS